MPLTFALIAAADVENKAEVLAQVDIIRTNLASLTTEMNRLIRDNINPKENPQISLIQHCVDILDKNILVIRTGINANLT